MDSIFHSLRGNCVVSSLSLSLSRPDMSMNDVSLSQSLYLKECLRPNLPMPIIIFLLHTKWPNPSLFLFSFCGRPHRTNWLFYLLHHHESNQARVLYSFFLQVVCRNVIYLHCNLQHAWLPVCHLQNPSEWRRPLWMAYEELCM